MYDELPSDELMMPIYVPAEVDKKSRLSQYAYFTQA